MIGYKSRMFTAFNVLIFDAKVYLLVFLWHKNYRRVPICLIRIDDILQNHFVKFVFFKLSRSRSIAIWCIAYRLAIFICKLIEIYCKFCESNGTVSHGQNVPEYVSNLVAVYCKPIRHVNLSLPVALELTITSYIYVFRGFHTGVSVK